MFRLACLGLGFLLAAPAVAQQERPLEASWNPKEAGLVLDVGVALTMDKRQVVHNARILIQAGKIASIGRQSDLELPQGWRHESYPEAFAYPGMVDLHTHSHTGGWNDINDSFHPNNPELYAADALVPWNRDYQLASASGMTTVNAISGSGSNMSGPGVLVKLKPSDDFHQVVVRNPGSVKVAQGYNPERGGADLGGTRMGMWWMLRWYLARAKETWQEDTLDERPHLASIVGIYQEKHPFLVHTAGARDTFGTVRMFQLEAEIPVVVSHASFHGYMAAEAIAEAGAHLNVGPRNIDFSFNQKACFQGLVEGYERAGNGSISVQTDCPVVPLEEFPFQATIAERFGCSTWTALESINVDPARQILAEDQFGRLIPGLDADIVVKAGQPLDPRSPVLLVLVDGEVAYDIRDGQHY
ncbi:MAG: hypothetical protein DWQ01_20185 [Planctomycetota bacterium]|nr:MAG: hypothetical protein DWQ01_20185 [Planctomycetota bacterium]